MEKKNIIKNKKGFTLIELLAVIVILGLLMAIAIPSVTKYITQSRKKTVVSSIDGYIASAVNSVNEQDYKFTTPNTIYAVPIECISLEKGGTNPFGEWHQSNNDYWAYVLVQYDSSNFSYNYGFTFKDSAGYGMYPTIQSEINPKSSAQITTGLELTKPTSGSYTNIASKDNWTGFNIDDSTQLVVLEAETEGTPGNGQTTCTLCQKGSNYEAVEEQKAIAKAEEALKDYTLIGIDNFGNTAFWKYRTEIKTITFQDSINIPSGIEDKYKWDVSLTGNGKVMAYITPNATNSSYYDLYIQGDGQLYANPDSSYLFMDFKYLDIINNLEILNTSKVTEMYGMFYRTGYSSTVFQLDLGENFDTSNVTSMMYMFFETGYSNPNFTLDLGDKFDTSNVIYMRNMFDSTGATSTKFTLDLGDKFNTKNVTNMMYMFQATGSECPVFTLKLGENFDTSNVTSMDYMFNGTGASSTEFTLDLGDKFNTSNVFGMSYMFTSTGYSNPNFTLDLGDNFDTSSVFGYGGMLYMFYNTGYSSTKFTLDLGDKFDTSNLKTMDYMFYNTGYSSTEFELNLGDAFNTKNVTSMDYMFYNTGYSSTKFTLDCRDWDVSNVNSHVHFNTNVSTKVLEPNWNN